MIYLVVIPLGLLVLPWYLARYVFVTSKTKNLPYRQLAPYLWLCSGLWVVSQIVPNVPISPETDTFSMHFIGGVVATILFLFVIRAYDLKFNHQWQLWLGLYLFVSALGVANELFEFFLDESGLMPMPNTDTWWDLTANTLGAFMALALARLFRHEQPKK